MRRPLTLLLPCLFAFALVAAASVLTAPPASAAPIAGAPITYCADPGTDPSMDTGAGTMITCDTTITNTITAIDPITGVASGSAVITVTECIGPASGRLDPSFLTCTTDTQSLVNLVTSVNQCDGVGYGGGNVLECNVDVINNFFGVVPQAIGAATVNQCNGSAPDTTGCNPFPATTTNATITQCNNSSYGGGQEDFNCTASGTTTATLSVTVNQCNDSNYGGGSWLNCSASLTNRITGQPTPAPTGQPAPTATPATSASPGTSASPTASASPAASASPTVTTSPAAPALITETPVVAQAPTPPPTSMVQLTTQGGTNDLPILVGLLVLVGLSLVAAARRFGTRAAMR